MSQEREMLSYETFGIAVRELANKRLVSNSF